MSKNPGECECCGYETHKLKKYKCDTLISGGGKVIEFDFWFCDLCAGSMASHAHTWLRPEREVHKTICYVGNVLLAALRGRFA